MGRKESRFQRLPKSRGLFYQPCQKSGSKKHPCPDCHFCQQCSPSRCQLCRSQKQESHPKLSLQEQIALYNRLNAREQSGE